MANITYDPSHSYSLVESGETDLKYDPTHTYSIDWADEAIRSEPTTWETAQIIGREVVPAIGGAMLGSIGGPVGMAGGGAAGSSWGNYLSQQYRA